MGLLVLAISAVNRAYRAFKPDEEPTTLDNLESRIKQWLDNFSFEVKRASIPDAHFRYLITTDSQVTIILGRLRNELSSYILLRIEVSPNDAEKAQIAKFSPEERAIAMVKTKIELNRARIGYSGFTSLDGGFAITKRIPISEKLSEDDLIEALAEIEAAYHLVFLTGTLFTLENKLGMHKAITIEGK